MQIIIEGYQYPAGSVDKVLWEGSFQTVDGKVSIGYVGYYWNDRLKDSVFVLPKVFLEPKSLGTGPTEFREPTHKKYWVFRVALKAEHSGAHGIVMTDETT